MHVKSCLWNSSTRCDDVSIVEHLTKIYTLQLHSEYLADQQKIRQELLTQFKDELDGTRSELEAKYTQAHIVIRSIDRTLQVSRNIKARAGAHDRQASARVIGGEEEAVGEKLRKHRSQM